MPTPTELAEEWLRKQREQFTEDEENTMPEWEKIAREMLGETIPIPEYVEKDLRTAANLTGLAGGRLESKEVIAAIIVAAGRTHSTYLALLKRSLAMEGKLHD